MQRDFLEAYAKVGVIQQAADLLNIDRMQHYKYWLKQPTYQQAFNELVSTMEEVWRDQALARMQELGDPKRGWTEEVIEETVVPVTDPDGKQRMVVTEARRKRVKRFSVAAAIWEANRKWGNPQRLELADPNSAGDKRMTLLAAKMLIDEVLGGAEE